MSKATTAGVANNQVTAKVGEVVNKAFVAACGREGTA